MSNNQHGNKAKGVYFMREKPCDVIKKVMKLVCSALS